LSHHFGTDLRDKIPAPRRFGNKAPDALRNRRVIQLTSLCLAAQGDVEIDNRPDVARIRRSDH
jgi:hypothetical protein